MKLRGFTLIELLMVLAIIAILAGILIVVIKPTEIFRKARDSQRTADLRNLATAIDTYIVEKSQEGNVVLDRANNTTCLQGGGTAAIYYSVARNASINIPSTYGTFTVATGNASTTINGTGWLPINFSDIRVLNLAKLPLDPINNYSSHYYYTYACMANFNYELNARLESSNAGANDGGNDASLYEAGPDKNILPASSTGFYR